LLNVEYALIEISQSVVKFVMNNAVDRYTQLEAALSLAEIEISVSEVHGTIVGAIANHMKSGVTPDLLKLIEPQADPNEGRFSQLNDTVYDLYRVTTEQLLEGQESYDLLLPDDDESLDNRVEGIATWARGYILGLLYNNAFSIDQLPESGDEIARDIMQIAEASAGDSDEREEDFALAELHEYIKVGSQLIFEFIYSERSSDTPKQQQ